MLKNYELKCYLHPLNLMLTKFSVVYWRVYALYSKFNKIVFNLNIIFSPRISINFKHTKPHPPLKMTKISNQSPPTFKLLT